MPSDCTSYMERSEAFCCVIISRHVVWPTNVGMKICTSKSWRALCTYAGPGERNPLKAVLQCRGPTLSWKAPRCVVFRRSFVADLVSTALLLSCVATCQSAALFAVSLQDSSASSVLHCSDWISQAPEHPAEIPGWVGCTFGRRIVMHICIATARPCPSVCACLGVEMTIVSLT